MLESDSLEPKASRRVSPDSGEPPQQLKQRRLMAVALGLLLIALVFVLYHDRDFWFPDTQEANEIQQPAPLSTSSSPPATQSKPSLARRLHFGKPVLNASPQPVAVNPPIVATATRTVLPPLEIEVIAGDSHRTIQPATNPIAIEVQSDSTQDADSQPASQADADAPGTSEDTAATVTSKAAERVQMSPDTSEAVSQSVKPGYPLLARQMKVQGSVVLLAMISREGLIQDLRVVSGPPILAGAAREAVKQWHFKPHYEGPQTVETVAKITVNFTISTN